jgi:GNAT superfamily N-acetyltransferase
VTLDLAEAGRQVDWVRRAFAPCRDGVALHEIPQGWVSVRPAIPCGEFPSSPGNRVFWHAPDRKIGAPDIKEALDATRELGGAKTFFWIAPWACDEGTERALAEAGATRWPHVEYLALAREAVAVEPVGSALRTEIIAGAELDRVLAHVEPWYSAEGVVAMRRILAVNEAQILAAYDGRTPLAMALLFVRGEWAYLGAAGTDPAHRNRGAQKALIRARVTRAAECGARWCVSETNTAVPVSLMNLAKCGFVPVIAWRVYGWTGAEA